MLAVTERATRSLKEILAAKQTPKDRGVKLVPGDSGRLDMVIDRPREGDAVVAEGEQRPLLIVDEALTERLDDVVLDASSEGQEGEEGPRFFLRRSEP